jgi:hypothetical protein
MIGARRRTDSCLTLSGLGLQPKNYTHLLERLAQAGWICHGTVLARPLRRRHQGRWIQSGPYYLWTCKVKGKTVCHALSQDQFQQLKRAIQNNRQVMSLLAQMQNLTLKTILKKVPGVRKRK